MSQAVKTTPTSMLPLRTGKHIAFTKINKYLSESGIKEMAARLTTSLKMRLAALPHNEENYAIKISGPVFKEEGEMYKEMSMEMDVLLTDLGLVEIGDYCELSDEIVSAHIGTEFLFMSATGSDELLDKSSKRYNPNAAFCEVDLPAIKNSRMILQRIDPIGWIRIN